MLRWPMRDRLMPELFRESSGFRDQQRQERAREVSTDLASEPIPKADSGLRARFGAHAILQAMHFGTREASRKVLA